MRPPALHLDNTTLAAVLLKPLADCRHTRRYKAAMDRLIDNLKTKWDLDTGLTAGDSATSGRAATAPMCWAAFCWYSPLSRHHGDPELLRFFAAGLRTFAESIDDSGNTTRNGLNGETWAHGWDIEGLIYGLHFCRGALAPKLLKLVRDRFWRAAQRHAGLQRTPDSIGSYGNQRCVWALGLYLYGQVFADKAMLALADQYFLDAAEKVLDASGQVIEQHGPCMHYSYTAFFYAWLNFAVRREPHADTMYKCLRWFRNRHTDTFTPVAGPSARQYAEVLLPVFGDLLPAAEWLAASDPSAREWVLRGLDTLGANQAVPPGVEPPLAIGSAHGTTPLLWAILFCPGEADATAEQRTAWDAPVADFFKGCRLLKRLPMPYGLVRTPQYQTHFNAVDYLPFAGVQTWAWQGEPPIVHPTPLAPSTTISAGVDTARHGASHNWGLYGAGAMGIDAVMPPAEPGQPAFILARYDWLWRYVIFTAHATVIFELGSCGVRKTLWTLNRTAPAAPEISPGVVRFAGRVGRLYASNGQEPVPGTTAAEMGEHEFTRGVQQLRYECAGGLTAFAFSDGAFSFDGDWGFRDAGGRYRLVPAAALTQAVIPRYIPADTWRLAYESKLVRVE